MNVCVCLCVCLEERLVPQHWAVTGGASRMCVLTLRHICNPPCGVRDERKSTVCSCLCVTSSECVTSSVTQWSLDTHTQTLRRPCDTRAYKKDLGTTAARKDWLNFLGQRQDCQLSSTFRTLYKHLSISVPASWLMHTSLDYIRNNTQLGVLGCENRRWRSRASPIVMPGKTDWGWAEISSAANKTTAAVQTPQQVNKRNFLRQAQRNVPMNNDGSRCHTAHVSHKQSTASFPQLLSGRRQNEMKHSQGFHPRTERADSTYNTNSSCVISGLAGC